MALDDIDPDPELNIYSIKLFSEPVLTHLH